MSIWKRGLALAGTALTLAAGPALLGSAPAAAAPITAPSNMAAGWSYQGAYPGTPSGLNACHRDGRQSIHPHECRYVPENWPVAARYQLWFWVN
ncbi:hypothetical protein [Spongiactinospora sp. TRM90649]|uniref:hypothetical protein n=1 Tax=Spongiactinospora sp. TRM90649 TaxID=3031114 RepID=UPI0023F862B6|nr:hypothetical protein [Spongiactinospora sp. TRM90649]MDF5758635.1 hypothetical protein [Spongiactinospora sp. TRM90649]